MSYKNYVKQRRMVKATSGQKMGLGKSHNKKCTYGCLWSKQHFVARGLVFEYCLRCNDIRWV